jgi:hypothetical protein
LDTVGERRSEDGVCISLPAPGLGPWPSIPRRLARPSLSSISAASSRRRPRAQIGSRVEQRKGRDVSESFFFARFFARGKNRAERLQRAVAGASNIALWIAQTAARTKLFTARATLQRLLEGEKRAQRLTVFLAQR